MTSDLLAFDIWAPFAFFRRSGTTTTSLTFSVLPRSAAEGLIGGILGFDFEESPKRLAAAKIAIGIQHPVRKIPFSATYTDTKEIWPRFGAFIKQLQRKPVPESRRKVEFHTRVKMELLTDPRYCIYFDDSEQTKNALEEKLLNHQTVFTPYLGSSSMIANFSFAGRCGYGRMKATSPTEVASVIPFRGTMPRIHLEKGATFAVEQGIPIHLTSERVLAGTYDAVYSPAGAKLKVLDLEVERVQMRDREVHVIFIPTIVSSEETA